MQQNQCILREISPRNLYTWALEKNDYNAVYLVQMSYVRMLGTKKEGKR